MTSTARVASKPFTGSFLWVNHDADSREAKPHRQRVFTHIQGRYRKFERESRNKALRASAKVPAQKFQAVAIPEHKEVDTRGTKSPKPHANGPQALPSPSFLKGNSDPFGTLAIEVTPTSQRITDLLPGFVHPSGLPYWSSRMEGLKVRQC